LSDTGCADKVASSGCKDFLPALIVAMMLNAITILYIMIVLPDSNSKIYTIMKPSVASAKKLWPMVR